MPISPTPKNLFIGIDKWIISIQEVLDDPQLQVDAIKEVRRLSDEWAVSNLHQCFKSVIFSLDKKGTERNNTEAAGLFLLSFIKSYYFIADILPHLHSLTCAFQRNDMYFTVVRPPINGTKVEINVLLVSPGELSQNFPSVLDELEYGVLTSSDSEMERFKNFVHN